MMPCWCAHVPIPHCPHCFHTCDPSLDSTTLVIPCWCARSKRRRHCPVRIFHTLMRPSWEPEMGGGGGGREGGGRRENPGRSLWGGREGKTVEEGLAMQAKTEGR